MSLYFGATILARASGTQKRITLGSAASFSPVALNIIGLLAIGLGAAFYWLDRDARTSRMLGLFLGSIGCSVLAGVNFLRDADQFFLFNTLLMSVPTAASFIFGPEWIRAVRAGIPAGVYNTQFGDRLVRIAQVLGLCYLLASIIYPEKHYALFLRGLTGDFEKTELVFMLLIATPLVLAVLLSGLALLITFRRKVNVAERRRMLGFGLAVPFLGGGLIIGPEHAAYFMLIGELFLIVGAIQYHILQAQRGDFMERFLPSQVVEALADKDSQLNLETGRQEITVVCCDLRKFTPYAEAHDSDHVIGLLRAYYQMVGEAAAECGATIKDYAGDGVLMLVGAPIAYDDHADRGIKLAKQIILRSKDFLAQWSEKQTPLGLGVGVATGDASVGVVGAERLEYAAVGPAINRSSRLCDKAKDGQALIDEKTHALAMGDYSLKKGGSYSLKGMNDKVKTWVFSK